MELSKHWLSGPENGQLIVLTHGATIDHTEWNATVPVLVEAGYRVLTWDMPGHGQSRPGKFDIRQAEQRLLELLNQVGVQQAIFVGHSLGGNLIQELVFHHSERVKALVVLDSTWNFQKLSRSEEVLIKMGGPIFKLYPRKMVIDQSLAISATSKESKDLMRKPMELLTKEEFADILLSSAGSVLHYEPDYRVPVPILLMMGDLEQTGNIKKAMPAWAKHDGIRLVVIPNAKHCANLDNPRVFHEELLSFLKSLK